MNERDEVTVLLRQLGHDPAGREARSRVCEVVSKGLQHAGQMLWVGGYLFGPDRAANTSPSRFGSDAMVGLATVVQTGGALGSGTVQLLLADNLYAAAALIRQLVEVEYLAWIFADDHVSMGKWLNASHKERLTFWSPGEL